MLYLFSDNKVTSHVFLNTNFNLGEGGGGISLTFHDLMSHAWFNFRTFSAIVGGNIWHQRKRKQMYNVVILYIQTACTFNHDKNKLTCVFWKGN